MTTLRGALAALALAAACGPAPAATVNFQIPSSNDGASYVAGPIDGVTVTLRSAFDDALGGTLRFNPGGVGVAATASDGSNALDGAVNDDALVVSFSAPVSLDRAVFGNVGSGDVILAGTSLGAGDLGSFDLNALGGIIGSLGIGSLFVFEAVAAGVDVRLVSIDFTPQPFDSAPAVPLPPAVLSFLGALGLLAWRGRRARGRHDAEPGRVSRPHRRLPPRQELFQFGKIFLTGLQPPSTTRARIAK